MAATLQQHCASNSNTTTRNNNNNTTASSPNPQLKRLVYSKYRELLGSYNDQANAYIDTLPSYMVHKDKGFNLELKSPEIVIDSLKQQNGLTNNHQEMYGSGQRMPAQQTYEAPACVQNAMMTKDKKPFTYTPGGIDLSQIKSERMAKRLARNAQAEGATGAQQHNRPTQPQSPGGQASSPNAAASMGAAAMGMPFQVLPPPPPPAPGKNFNGGSAPAPPPPPPSSSNFSNTGTLAPPTNGGGAGAGRGSAPNSPSMPRKSPTPQRFEPPPMGFRPEIKIPPNPMAALRKVPPPVEKNTFWKDEYVKERSKSPMVEVPNNNGSHSNNTEHNDSVNSASSSPQTTNATNNGTATMNNDNIDGFKKTMPTTTTNNNGLQQNQTNNNYTNYQPQQQQQLYTPPTPNNQQQQQSPIKPLQQSPQYSGVTQQSPQLSSSPLQTTQMTQQQQSSPQQTSRPEFRSVAAPTSPAVNIYTRQTDSPRTAENATPPRATESPFKFAQQQQQQRAPPAVSPLAQQSTPSTASSGASVSPNNQAQTVPWRTQRSQPQQQQQAPAAVVAQSHPQPIYNNVQAHSQPQQQQRTPDFSTQQSAYQGPKPTNIGSLYIAPLAPPTEPQAQHIVRQQMQQQQQRDSPMRQMPAQQQQPTGPGASNQQLRWMSTQPLAKEQPAWARPEENGNVVPSSLNRIKSPPPSAQPQSMYQQQPLNSGNNGFMPQAAPQNFGAQPMNTTGLRLQINSPVNLNNSSQNGPKERIIPIQLEQTPTYTPAQPSFNQAQQQQQHFGAGGMPPAPGYVVRTPNQFVDQGYNNFGQQQQQQQSQPQRVMSPTLQQLNAPRMVQQTQNNVATGNKTHIIPIALENNDGTRGPISKTPIVIQNGDYNLVVYDCPLEAEIRFRKNRLSDQRTPPVQSKSFRILQKITDTIDDGSNDDNANQQQQQQQQQQSVEPQLQRPTFARQMSAQQARHSPTVEQMRRMQIGHEQDNSQQYIPPSEQQITEPKKYTGSAIPSRSFKILQAMTQPENADEQENCENNNEMNEIVSKPESNRHSYASTSSTAEPVSSCSSTSISSELAFSSSPSPTPPPSQPLSYPPYPYPYGYPWYPPPPPPTHMPGQNGESGVPTNWHYPYPMHSATPPPQPMSSAGEQSNPPTHYPPYAYYYPYYPPPPHMSPYALPSNRNSSTEPSSEYDLQNMYPSYMPPPPPYLAYPYPVAPSYSHSSSSSRASSVLPDIIITPSTDDVPSQVIMKHHIKVEKEPRKQREGSIEIEDVTSLKSNPPPKGTVVDILTQHLQNMSKGIENNLNSKRQAKKSYKKNIEQKSPEDNTSPVQITMATESEKDSETETSDSDITPKQMDKKGPVPLKSIRSVNNIQIYNGKKIQQGEEDSSSESESDDDDETTADGESDIFDEEEDEEETHEHQHDFELEEHIEQESETSDSEGFIIDDNLSVIYEEESEMEKSSDMAKTVIRGDRSTQSDDLSLDKDDPPDELPRQIEENDEEDSTSVTVRLPLKFSFSSSKDADNIATVEVGKSQIEEKRNSISLAEKRNSFSVATLKSDSEDNDYDDCDVSVTISLTQSSKSNSLEAKVENKNKAELYPIEDMSLPEEALQKIESSQEDVSVSLSLNMRNKFAPETINGGLTNNIALVKETKPVTVPTPTVVAAAANNAGSPEEMDFFATLMATKMQAQKIKEQSASYWGKSTESKEETAKESDKQEIQENKEKEQTSLESKETKVNFWSNYSETKEETAKETQKQEILKEDKSESIEQEQTSLESKESKMNFWSKYSQKTKEETSVETKQEETKTFIQSKASTNSSSMEMENKTNEESSKSQEEIKKPKFSFWDRCSSIPKEEKKEVKETKAGLDSNFWERYSKSTQQSEKTETQIEVQTSQESSSIASQEKNEITTAVETKEPTFWERYSKPIEHIEATETKSQIEDSKPEEIEDIWAQRDEDAEVRKPSFTFWNKHTNTELNESSSIAQTTEEVVDIWADRVEDLPPIKPTVSKLKSLESAKNSFWSSVSEANKTVEPAKPIPEPECITIVEFNLTVLRSFVKEVPQPQIASVHYEEENVEEIPVEEPEETEEIDFWAQIEPARKSPEPKIIVKEPAYYNSFTEQQQTPTYINSFGEQECSMYNDDNIPTTADHFDPLKYPEEPREVDTDEEIDFWAEIEAKHQREDNDDDVTFHKSASFWASRERHNSVDETPYKPVLPKAFHAKLPDEPPSADINIWEALEAHKGEEPVIIDPAVEEDKALVQEYDEMAQQEVPEVTEEEHNDDAISVHEAVVATVWCPPAQINQVEETEIAEQPEVDIWPPPPTEQEMSQAMEEVKTERDELEIKRNNYRKAMAFFTTSIDENKEQSVERYERTSRINSQRSSCIEEENEKWDWDAVSEALQQDSGEQKAETIVETVAAPIPETLAKEQTPQVIPEATAIKEETPLPEVYVEPTLKRLSNGLPDLEVNKFNEERKISVKARISAFESGSVEQTSDSRRNSIKNQSLSVESYTRQSSLSRNSSTQRSESEMDEDDSGVTDMNKQLSETDTESESFPELRKMSSYQRAATHSRLFKLLQDDPEVAEANENADEFQFKPSRRKIIHNVSITRKQNPKALAEAETMTQRRERLSLPLRKNTSIDADNPSTPNSPASPIMGHSANKSSVVSDKLVSELVQSLLLKSDSTHFKKLPMEKLQAAAKRVLEEELDSLENTSVDSTPAMTPNDMKKDKSYADYYNTWSDAQGSEEIVPSKSFRALQDSRRSPWTARCPRVLGSKPINLARVTESPEISMRTSKSPECFRQSRESSIGKWKKS
ncbi:protein piccolo isoform X3 [Lucilia cuprina]|uniref:protein piccolo isoform X3 n=1 Tax=Lucilia cuprina TaxID=7375 RepID=UPI001F059D4F|nr:protein piccolo isoform X3 [Lucilia cuprina]